MKVCNKMIFGCSVVSLMTVTLAGLWRVDWLIHFSVSFSRVQAQHLRCGPMDYCSSPTQFQKQKYFNHTSKNIPNIQKLPDTFCTYYGGQIFFSKNNFKDTTIVTTLIICKWDCYEKTNIIKEFLFPVSINNHGRHDKGDLTKADPVMSSWVI